MGVNKALEAKRPFLSFVIRRKCRNHSRDFIFIIKVLVLKSLLKHPLLLQQQMVSHPKGETSLFSPSAITQVSVKSCSMDVNNVILSKMGVASRLLPEP